MKILSNKEYFKMVNEIKGLESNKNSVIDDLVFMNEDYKLQIEEILNRLKEMVSPANAKMSKDKYRERIKDLIIFIQGKQR